MRKLLILIVSAVVGATALCAQPITTPYQYRHRLFVAFQGGPSVFVCDYSNVFGNHGHGWDILTVSGQASLGYFFTDAHQIRVSLGYGPKKAVLPPYEGFFPYKFQSLNLFADYVLSFYPLGEYNVPFNPQFYAGVGMGTTFGFQEPEYHLNNPDEMDLELVKANLQKPYPFNLVPAVRLGGILEYDFPNNLGVFFDFGAEFFGDRYNGLDVIDFPVDIQINATFGVVYHLGKSNIKIR